ncbi:putative HMG box protein [Colletotrichum sublineola]|uniref:Putative HMG box protein n=1 Tax=Colletotrichum sublineola TaxID=1173701 RepID=A0A066XZD8_COLSU|nr:putative HMG box protein [Colletotrichum sublineola]
MLTAIGRAATQRLFLRAVPWASPRTQVILHTAYCGFSTSQWARMPAKASSTATKTKKSTEAKGGAATKKKVTAKNKTKEKAATEPKEKKKPGPTKRVKVLTPEEKEKLDVRKWKKLALLPDPKRLPTNKWMVYVRLQEKADENKLINNANYKAWVESHTPQAVAQANLARLHLRKARGRAIPAPIRDDRQPTRPPNAYMLFVKSRWASGDFADLPLLEASSRIGEEWKGLSESRKGTFRDLAKAESDRYARESLNVLGRVVRTAKTSE